MNDLTKDWIPVIYVMPENQPRFGRIVFPRFDKATEPLKDLADKVPESLPLVIDMSEATYNSIRTLARRDVPLGYAIYYFWCPGCKHCHGFRVGGDPKKDGPQWDFNGDMEKPTFSPSLRMFVTDPETKQEKTICHLHLIDGEISFCGDGEHDHKNKTVPLTPIPENYGL